MDEGNNTLPEPKGFDYFVAIVFLFIFSLLALVAGLYSNITALVYKDKYELRGQLFEICF